MEKQSNKKIVLKLINKLNLFSLLILLLSSCDSKSQQSKVETSIWSPEFGYEKREYKGETILVFEENFNDSIQLFKGNKHLKDLRIKTNKSAGVVPLFYKIERIDSKKNESLKILFVEKDETITANLGNRLSYIYISRTREGDYFIEHSDFMRKYY